MRRFYTLVVSFILSTSLFAYTPQRDTVFEGARAKAYYSNASVVRLYKNTSIPAFIKFDDANMTITEAQALLAKLGQLDSHFGFEFIRDEQDELGFTHSKYNQTYDGIPFYDGVYIFHTKNGKVYSMNGKCYDAPVKASFILNERDALAKAKAFMGASLFKWEMPEEEAHLKHEQNDANATYFPKTMKYIVPSEGDFYSLNPSLELCYAFDIYAHEPLDKKRVFVNAQTGTIAFYDQLLQHATVTGTANTAYSGTQSIKTDSTSPINYRLRETGRGLGVETYNLLKGTNYAAAVDFTDSNNIWNNINANQDQYATDAHWGCEMTYDYYFYKHGRNSINNAGFKLMSYIHYSTNYTNAFWDGTRMTYGDGASPYTPLVAMDIAGHEVTHGLTSNTSNLTYSYESGALNESFSDIFGVSIDFYSRPTLANYLMGDGIGGTPFRSMANPNLYSDPDCYNGSFWYTGTADNGGVHTNSGVQNFWYYLMINGGSGTNDLGNAYTVSRLGLDTAGKIAFRNNTVYLSPSSQYADARFYAIQSAIDLYGCGSDPVKQTTNAWYAVGVGAKWDSTIVVDFTANPTTNCTVPSIHAFTNLSGSGTYQWFFGDGNTSTLINPSNTYMALGSYSVKLIATCGLKKDSLTKTNYIVLSAPLPVSFTKIKDTVICEKSSIQLYANSNLGPVKWEFQNVIDTVVTVAPLMTSIYKISKANTCQTFYDSIIVTVNRTPKVTGTASALSSCQGAVDTLKGSCTMRSSAILQLGTSTTTTNTNGNTPYNRTWEGSRTQYLIRASELTGIGASAGPIKSLQFNVTNAGSGTNHQKNFTIKMGHTSNTTITGAFAVINGTFNTVYGPATQNLPTVGWNIYNFPAPFIWDGVSNIVVEICHDNDLNNTCASCFSPNATVQYSTTTFNANYSNFSDNAQRCGTIGGSTSGYTTTRRPNMKFDFYTLQPATASATWLWTPGNMTTANATVIPPTMPTSSYKVVATNAGTSCKDSATVNINVVTPLTLVARTDSTICSGNPIRLTATASSGTITWNPGGLIGSNVLINPVTTTNYVAQVTNACGTIYDTVKVTVIPTPTLVARTDTFICSGFSVNLTAVSNISPITWNPGGMTGASVSVSPATTTSYFAQVSNVCGVRNDTVVVTVNTGGLPSIIAGNDTTICNGGQVNLTASSSLSPITWTPGGMTGSSVFVSPSVTTSYIAKVTNVCGSAMDTVIATVIPIPTLTARTDSTICATKSINLTATSNISPITWNPGALTGSPVLVTPASTTAYIATVSNFCGIRRDTVNVTVLPQPSILARTDSTICAGSTINLTATANISPITWNPGGLTGGSVFVAPATTTNYTAQVTNACGTARDTVRVTVIPLPTLLARTDSSICATKSINLTATSNITPITWTPGSMTGSPVLVTPASTTAYIAQVSNACGIRRDTVNVTIIPIPTLTARLDSTICAGNNFNLTATSNISPITWNPGALTGGSVFVNPATTTAYIAQSTNACGTARDTVNVTVIPVPTLTARTDSSICFGATINLTANSNISPITWNPGGMTGSSIPVVPAATTAYYAQVSNACGSKIDTVNITVVSIPTIAARPDSTICSGNSFNLTATSNISPITWNPGSLTGGSVFVNPVSTTAYVAQVSNMCGTAKDTVNLTVIPIPTLSARADTGICNGQSVWLTASSNISPITWNPGSLTGSSVSVSPNTSTMYTVQVSNACGLKIDTVNIGVTIVPSIIARADSTICNGNSINLTATANISPITWNPGALVGGSIFVSPSLTTPYIAQVSNACGIAKDTVNINVILVPSLTARADTGICNGQSVWLTATSNISPITWNPGSLNGAAVNVNPTTTTQYIAQVNNACGLKNDTVNIAVTNVPVINARTDSSICAGQSILLTATSNVSPITWNPGAMVGSSVSVSPSTTTNYIAQSSNVCGTKVDTVLITVIPQPSIVAGPDTSFCNGFPIILHANANLPITWNPGNVVGNYLAFYPSSNTQYIGTVQNACGVKRDTVNATVLNKPVLTARLDSTICAGNSILLSANSSSPIIWNPGNMSGSNVIVSPTVTTAYIAQSTNACGTSKDTVNIAVIAKPYVIASADDSFCIGSSIQITATSFLPITWNPGGLNGSPVIVNPISNTQYIAQVSNACGIAKDTVNIKVVQQPAITAIADTVACPTNPIKLTANANANILWTPGNIAGPLYNVVASTNAMYVATASNLCGAKKDTVNITVLSIPTLSARADTSICVGQNVQIFANSNINAAIWTPGNINGVSFNVNPTITTQYIGTSSNKCGIAKDTVLITVNPLATVLAMNDTAVCMGDSIELTATGLGNMVWSTGAFGNKTKVKPIVVTNYSVTSSNICNSATDFVRINVLDRVKASAIYSKSGNKYTFTNTSLFANSQLWLFGDGKSDTSKNPIHTYTNKGNYTVKLIAKNACGNDTFVMTNLTVTSSVSNLIALTAIKVFPNPANDVFYIQSEGAEIDVNAISITDALGRSIQLPIEKNNNEFRCNSSQLASGLYLIKVSLGENYTTINLLIER